MPAHVNNQAEHLRYEAKGRNVEEPVASEKLPSRLDVHRRKRRKKKKALSFPLIRILLVFFFLIVIGALLSPFWLEYML
ncbi:hypothetical protein [Halalkalibacterium halodurans]|uniref:hypothetical protein n=1 Tax=Halalkalibacterium halodurans TaxID=86665 RepID=UPI002E1A8B94|nr:hypothetical protein [Halalkalibacterium halodurans]